VQLDSLVGVVGGDVTVYHGNKPGPAVNRTPRCEDRSPQLLTAPQVETQ